MINLNIFDFEGYQVVKLKDIKKLYSQDLYRAFVEFLRHKTLAMDKDRNTLVFYSDLKNWEDEHYFNTIRKINGIIL